MKIKENNFFLIEFNREIGLKITYACHHMKLAICCQTTPGVPIAPTTLRGDQFAESKFATRFAL